VPGVWIARSGDFPSSMTLAVLTTKSGANVASCPRAPAAEHLRAGGGLDAAAGRRVIQVRVGAKDPAIAP
jgi:hypothetical protein